MSNNTTLQDIQEWVDEEFNHMTAYDRGGYLVYTNGSAGYHIELRLEDNEIKMKGNRYGEKVEGKCKAEKEEFVNLITSNL